MDTLLPISLADVAYAVRRLSPDQEAFELIAGVLGFKIESDDVIDKTKNPLHPFIDTGGRVKSITEIPNLPQKNEAPPKSSHKKPDVNLEGDSDGAIVVETLSPRRSWELPPYIEQFAPLDSAAFSLLATQPRPLLPRHQARSFVWEMLAQDLPSTEIDCDAIIDQLSRGLIPELRFLNRKSIRKRVHLLVDESQVMLPYSNDMLDLQRSIKNVAGQSLSGVFSFDELPDRGVAKSTGEQLSSYPFPGPETTILLVSDLGVTRPFGYQHVSANEWAGFLKRLVGSGCRVLVVSPYDEDRLGKLHYEGVSIVHWATKHHSNTTVSVQDFARLLSPAALLDMAFIREARIKLFPEASPGLEADLLFSWLIAVFNSRVVSFRQETVRALREELKSKPFELEKALDFLKKYRAGENEQSRFRLPERVIFEEQLVTDALTENKASVEQALERIIRSLVDDDMNPKLARWAIAVAEELPASVTDAPSYRDLKLAAQLRLGIISQDFHAPDRDNTSDGNRSWLLPKEVKLGIRRENGKLIISDSLKGAERSINVPGTVPRHLVVEKEKERVSVQIWPGQPDVSLPFGLPMEISSPLSGVRYDLHKTEFPPDELLIFIGHSDDASAEAQAIVELQSEIEMEFELLRKVSDGRSPFRRIRLWEWSIDERATTADQEAVVTPALDHAHIAIFVFRDRVGKVTWQKLEKARKGSPATQPYVFAFFPETPPLRETHPNDQAKEQAARDWATLMKRKEELTRAWTNPYSTAVTPCPTYQDSEGLKTVVREKVRSAIADILLDDISRPKAVELTNNADALRRYQEALKEELGTISLLGIPMLESVPVNLTDTFVPLHISDIWRSEKRYIRQTETQSSSPEKVMSVAFTNNRLLLVIGDLGSGKTTLLKYYALSCLDNKGYKKLGFKKPVVVLYLPLRELMRAERGDYESLPFNLSAWSDKHSLNVSESFFSDWLHTRQTLLLLDGLDEIREPEQRVKACYWIDQVVNAFPKTRVVVTSRSTGYRKDDGIELQSLHVRADIMDFSPEQQAAFLHRWFKAAFLAELPPDRAEKAEWQKQQKEKAAKIEKAIVTFLAEESNKRLRLLAGVPLLLQIMAMLWKERNYLPKSRVELFDVAIKYILDYRDRRRKISLLLSAEDALRVLSPVALWMQEELQTDEADRETMQEKMQELLNTLNHSLDTRNNSLPATDFCRNLVDRAGLLVEYGEKEYVFRHKSFREYLASVALVRKVSRTSGYLDQLVTRFGDDWWEETLLFFIGQVDGEVFDAFLQRLFDSPISDELSQKQQYLLITLVEEAPERRIDALRKKLLDPSTTPNRQRYILECLKTIGTTDAHDAVQRSIETGIADNAVLHFACDISGTKELPFSVVLSDKLGAQYVLIKGGTFMYSLTKKTENVPDLYFAKYKLTNELYRCFINYLDAKEPSYERVVPLEKFKEMLLAKSRGIKGFSDYLKNETSLVKSFCSDSDNNIQFNKKDQPVVAVCWYAATAYCYWLSLVESGGDDTNLYRLPTEKEWEYAAGGQEGRIYPWGNQAPSSTLANYNENEGATTPVGRYPDGATPEGLFDMAGNAREWMESWYDKDVRSLRGGSWLSEVDALCCSSRGGNFPGSKAYDYGFRVVRSSASVIL